MAKRLLDVVCAAAGLLLTAPVLAAAILAIRLASRGPAVFRTRRAGIGGRPFVMYKLRTMQVEHGGANGRVTGADDPRVFAVGRFLRRTKIDELPQLVNVLRGDMAVAGPRPEDPYFVAQCYQPLHRETLAVRPGLASPGSLFHDTHGYAMLAGGDPDQRYLDRLLPLKLALDLVYVRRASLWYDLRIITRTLVTIAATLAGRRRFPDPPELAAARLLVEPVRPAAADLTAAPPAAGKPRGAATALPAAEPA